MGGMLGGHFSARFFMELIDLLRLLGWSIRGRSGLCPLGLSHGLFLFLQYEIGFSLGFADFGSWFCGALYGE